MTEGSELEFLMFGRADRDKLLQRTCSLIQSYIEFGDNSAFHFEGKLMLFEENVICAGKLATHFSKSFVEDEQQKLQNLASTATWMSFLVSILFRLRFCSNCNEFMEFSPLLDLLETVPEGISLWEIKRLLSSLEGKRG